MLHDNHIMEQNSRDIGKTGMPEGKKESITIPHDNNSEHVYSEHVLYTSPENQAKFDQA